MTVVVGSMAKGHAGHWRLSPVASAAPPPWCRYHRPGWSVAGRWSQPGSAEQSLEIFALSEASHRGLWEWLLETVVLDTHSLPVFFQHFGLVW